MKRFSIPIIGWVIIGLVLVGALPFVVTWLQIERSRDALVVETQQTQRLVARSVAEETARYFDLIQALMQATADDPALYLQPDSSDAEQSLRRLLEMQPDIQAVGSFVERDGLPANAVFQLRRAGVELLPEAYLGEAGTDQVVLVDGGSQALFKIDTTRPGLFLLLLANIPALDSIIRMPGISESRIAILGPDGGLLTGDPGLMVLVPQDSREELVDARVPVGSNSDYTVDPPRVWAHAIIPGSGLRVLTMQPARAAEKASAEMRAAANVAFGLVLVVVGLLSLGAWWFVVRPIRHLVRAQSRITGTSAVGGGEIAQLQSAFERLENALEDRDALTEVFLDRFQILKILGSGAMGTVYLGWDPKLSRKVALKTIRLSADISADERERLANRLLLEGKTAAKLTHGNIVTVYDVVGDERHAFIAMQYVEGESVAEILDRERALPPAEVAEIAEGVLCGLIAAHREQVIHRDIKPANIMRSVDGVYMLSDFGIASMRDQVARGDEGLVLGTPGYLAPESYASKVHNAQTDLFAVGVTLVECLTGGRPFAGRSLEQIISRTVRDPVVMPAPLMTGMPRAMRSFVDQLLEKRPLDRFKTAQEALDALLEFKAEMGELVQTADGQLKRDAEQSDRLAEETSRMDVGGGTRRIDP